MSLILDLLFPRFCLKCHRPGDYFCPHCLGQQITKSPVISDKKSKIEGYLSLFKYDDLIKQLITEVKYGFVTDIIDPLVDTSVLLIKKNFPHLLNYWQKNNFIIVPIPLHPLRQNWRGFNQSILIGKKIAKKLKLKFSEQVLFRVKDTHTQAKLKNKQEKHNNLQNAFICSDQKIPSNIIIFDDVSTTFSTLNSALEAIYTKHGSPVQCWFLTLSGR